MSYIQWLEAVTKEAVKMSQFDDGSKDWFEHYNNIADLLENHDDYRRRYVADNPGVFSN